MFLFKALITAILVMLEGVALISGSILFLVLQFRVLDATHVICFYFLIVFIVTPFAIFVIFSASLSVYGVKKVTLKTIQFNFKFIKLKIYCLFREITFIFNQH